MSLEQTLNVVPLFVLVVFRLAGMMIYAPFFGSGNVPKRVKLFFTLVMAMGLSAGVKAPAHLPDTPWELAVGIGAEMMFGLAMGMAVSFIFVAAQWSGEIIGQQIGFNAGAVVDPQYSGGGTLVSDLYMMLSMVVFLAAGGHHALIRGVRASFDALPLLSAGMDRPLFDLIIGLFQAAATLAFQLAAPMLVTMLVVDLGLGVIGKTMPQMNIMTAGLSIRLILGVLVLLLGASLTSSVIRDRLIESFDVVQQQYSTPRPRWQGNSVWEMFPSPHRKGRGVNTPLRSWLGKSDRRRRERD